MKLFFGLLALLSCLNCAVQAESIECDVKDQIPTGANPSVCTMTYFDRTKNLIWPAGTTKPDVGKDEEHNRRYVEIIRGGGTKVLYSGTILDATYVQPKKKHPTDKEVPVPCSDDDWRIVAMARESSNILIYGPADVSEFCKADNNIVVVMPVTVIWAQLFRSGGNLKDPLRKAPGPVPDPDKPNSPAIPAYCENGFEFPASPKRQKFQPKRDIRTCDRYSWLRFMYNSPAGPIYNSWTQPGASQGTISYVPAIGKVPNTTGAPPGEKAPSETLSFDVQEYPSQMWGYGYIGVPIVFEKANAATANLNSLVFGPSYDVPFAAHHKATFPKRGDPWRLFARLPDLRIQYGPELAVSTPHDLNLTAALTARLPIVFNAPGRPSLITLFPVGGLEGGNHIVTHAITGQPQESNPVFRKVVGYDASLRAPFIIVHAFLGDKPATIDFSWRTRYLSYEEPLTDYVSGYPERLTKQQRSYWRGSFIVPFSQLAQFKVTVQHGALPPDFDYLGYSVNVGLTLGNPGYTEH